MSRLLRPFLCDRYIFVTVNLLRSRGKLEEGDYGRLAISLARMRQKHRFLLTAWVFLPDHWHAIIYPPYPLTISLVFSAVKVSSTIAINRRRHEAGELWQGVFLSRRGPMLFQHLFQLFQLATRCLRMASSSWFAMD